MIEPGDGNAIVDEAEQILRRREACRVWECTIEEAARLDTPLRWKAWEIWRTNTSGTAPDFFRECTRVLDILMNGLTRHLIGAKEMLAMRPRPDLEYRMKRLAIVAGDVAVALAPFDPAMIACVAADFRAKLAEQGRVIVDVFVECADWYRRHDHAPEILTVYTHFAHVFTTAWHAAEARRS
jgi:hypothetical protein